MFYCIIIVVFVGLLHAHVIIFNLGNHLILTIQDKESINTFMTNLNLTTGYKAGIFYCIFINNIYLVILTVVLLNLQETWSTASIDRFKELCAATEFLHMTVIRAEGTVPINSCSWNDFFEAYLKSGMLKSKHGFVILHKLAVEVFIFLTFSRIPIYETLNFSNL